MSEIYEEYKEQRKELQSKRVEFAVNALTHLGFEVDVKNESTLEFQFKGKTVVFFPYTGWHSGKTIKDGRGIGNLIKQLKNE